MTTYDLLKDLQGGVINNLKLKRENSWPMIELMKMKGCISNFKIAINEPVGFTTFTKLPTP